MTVEDLIFYAEFSPPKSDETHGAYTKRREKMWADTGTAFDKADVAAFHQLAGELFFPKEPPKPGAPRLTGAELARRALEEEHQRLAANPIHFSRNFEAHMFEGEDDGTKHKGLHSLVRLNRTPGAVTALRVIERDQRTGTYSADVTLRGKSASKASSFFPDAWSEERVKTAIKEAYIDTRRFPGHSISEARKAGALSWVGRYNLDGQQMLIGGLGDGDKPGSGIATAFPSINGAFRDEN